MDLAWLLSSPIAHRGLHDQSAGIIENSASAFARAISGRFSIECDVQRTIDGEAVVFHDFTLDRLTGETGPLARRTAGSLQNIRLRGSADTIRPLADLLDQVAGAVPLIVEIKSAWDGDTRLVHRTLELIAHYQGPLAIKSFDDEVVASLRDNLTRIERKIPIGIVAMSSEAAYLEMDAPPLRLRHLAQFLHYERTRPDFLSHRSTDLRTAVPYLCRTALGMPVLTWTVRSAAGRDQARSWADQIIFENFDPTIG